MRRVELFGFADGDGTNRYGGIDRYRWLGNSHRNCACAQESVLDVPFSIQAFNADQLKAQNITDTSSLQTIAGFDFQQGVSTQGDGREFPGLTFRGMQSTYGGDNDNSGAVFVDGIYIPAGIASIDTADVTRVEVLKGPQNVYFGKNTFGGAINYMTANPVEEFGGSIQASESAMGSTTDILTLEGPIAPDLLTGRLTLENYEKAAQYHTTDGGDLGAEATHSVTGVLYATPTPQLWIRFRGHYQVDDDFGRRHGIYSGERWNRQLPRRWTWDKCRRTACADHLGPPLLLQFETFRRSAQSVTPWSVRIRSYRPNSCWRRRPTISGACMIRCCTASQASTTPD